MNDERIEENQFPGSFINCKRTSEGELITQKQIPAATCVVDRTPVNVNVNVKHQSKRHHKVVQKTNK